MVKELKKKLEDAQKGFEDVSKRCRELEAGNLAKERMINDLRLQVPATVDRAIAITSVIGQPGIPAACLAADGGVESNRALQVNIYYGSERIYKTYSNQCHSASLMKAFPYELLFVPPIFIYCGHWNSKEFSFGEVIIILSCDE